MRNALLVLAVSVPALMCFPVLALSATGESPAHRLETVSPRVLALEALTEHSVSITFNESMLALTATDPSNYLVDGPGQGTLAANPSTVTGTGPYVLGWDTGEMQDGQTLNVCPFDVMDALGNRFNPNLQLPSCTAFGVAPGISHLTVTPFQASVGVTVTISFEVSEALTADPVVTVNGHDAVRYAKSTTYSYHYIVQESDPLGPATVSISVVDLAGNMQDVSSNYALSIGSETADLPLNAWPVLAVIIAAVFWVCVRRKRALVLVFVLGLSLPALAIGPTVSNVDFTQTANWPDGTRIDIYYDLVTPDFPCNINITLSKDGGADGYVYPVELVNGDIQGVTTGTGKHIVWFVGSEYPEEDIPQARIRLTATEVKPWFTLRYTAGANGTVDGTSPQTVERGTDGTPVTAIPDDHYHFVQWSDSSAQNPRADIHVTASVDVTAVFALDTFSLTYATDGNGSISGVPVQTVNYGASGSAVIAVPNPGFHFVQWSDGLLTATRTDTNVIADVAATATFAPSSFTVTYAAGANGAITGDSPQTLTYYDTGTPVAAVPDAGYMFSVWSDGLATAARTETQVSADVTYTAHFVPAAPAITAFSINNTEVSTQNSVVTLNNAATHNPTEYMASESGTFDGALWIAYDTAPSFALSAGEGSRTVYFKVRNAGTESGVVSDTIQLTSQPPAALEVTAFAINNDEAAAMNSDATNLNNTCTGTPTEYMASESDSFTDAAWQPYASAPAFALSFGVGSRTVYFKVRNAGGDVSPVVSDTIFLTPRMVSVAAGQFIMGRTSSGDDTAGTALEDPRHPVTLSAYQLGWGELTAKEFCDVMNWAAAKGYLLNQNGLPLASATDVPVFNNRVLFGFSPYGTITFEDGSIVCETRSGLPIGTIYDLSQHPAVYVSWFGAVMFCNWLSEWQGLTPPYDASGSTWFLKSPHTQSDGYRLPTEAEWERAAAWDVSAPGGPKHWIYAFRSDTLSGAACCNFYPDGTNPLGLSGKPYTTPAGWYNGLNVNPRYAQTVDSPSPVGTYDMSGNVYEWCDDWQTPYTTALEVNPHGETSTVNRSFRSGYNANTNKAPRTAWRGGQAPTVFTENTGFRVARAAL